MPSKTSSVMDEKVRFVFEYERDEQTMSDLCAEFGISRETRYVWLRRYRQCRLRSLVKLNRTAHRHPSQTPESWRRRFWSFVRRTCAGACRS